MRAEQTPVTAGLHATHEEIGNPHGVEQIACTLLLRAGVGLELQKGLDIRVPRLQIDGEAAAAPTSLVDVTRRVVEDAEHGDETVGDAIRASDP